MIRWIVIALACAGVGSCAMVPGHLYPLDGPLAQQSPGAVYPLQIVAVAASASVTATIAGESFHGSWHRVAGDDPEMRAHAADWDRIYGAGYFQAHVLGNPMLSRASMSGDRGNVLAVEFLLAPEDDRSGVQGIGKDGVGNLFKLTAG